jgi:quercetin dioxygenase-like cupin family protein
MKKSNAVRVATFLLALSNMVGCFLIAISLTGCTADQNKDGDSRSSATESQLFPKGQLGPATNFTGNAYNFGLVPSDSVYNTLVGNVYFEAGARSNWHTHASGQILIILDGEGYHQIEGQPRQIMKRGDVVKCPPNNKHWHGATENSSLSQMYIVPNTEKGIVTWMEPVTDEQYQSNQK